MGSYWRERLWVPVALLSGFALWTLPPTLHGRPQEVFRGRIDLMQFDVIVLDGQRRPVEGLTAADFTVFEDGVARPIDTFAPIALSAAKPDAAVGSWTRDGHDDVVTNQFPDEGRLVVIMMDRSIMAGSQAIAARDIVGAVVEALGPNDLAAIVRNNGFRNDGRVHGFTGDKTRLRAVAQSPFTGFIEPPIMTPLGLIETPPDMMRSPSCVCGICVLESIARVAEAMQNVPRRQKTLLFVGSNILIQEGAGSTQGECSSQLMLAREKTMHSLDRSNVTVHSIDPSGLESLAGGFGLGRGTTQTRGSHLVRQGNLAVLPDYTGGRTVLNTNAPQTFVQSIFDESRSYYLLGLARQAGASVEKRREIRIEVNRKDVTVRSRRGYYPSDLPESEHPAADPLTAALVSTLPKRDLPLSLALTPAFRPDGTPALTTILGIQTADPLAFTADAVQFDVLTGVFDMRARAVGSERRTIEVPAVLLSEVVAGFESRSELDLTPGSYEVRVGVVQAGSGRSGSVYGYVDIPEPEDQGLALSGVFIQAIPALPVGFSPRENTEPLIPTLRRAFTRDDEVTASMQIRLTRENLRTVSMRTRIIDDQDQTVTTSSKPLDSTMFSPQGLAEYRFDVPIFDLSTGRYLLRLEASSGAVTKHREVPFEVR